MKKVKHKVKFYSILKTAINSIVHNKLRSLLTILGLVIGIASVIILVGIGNGASTNVEEQVKSLGSDILTASVTSEDRSFSYEQMEDIEELENVESVAPYKSINAQVTRNTSSVSQSSIMAVTDSYLTVSNTKLNEGRNISVIDIENQSKVCILGSKIVSSLFSLTDPIGETIKINGDNYTVIGVLQEQGTSMGNNIDNLVLIPFSSAKHLGEDTSINELYIKVENEDNINFTINEIENYIRQSLEISSDYYSVSSQDSVLDTMGNVNNTLSLFLAGIASISLIVGGIGVMNVMLVSVTERTQEIGIRKSFGARKTDILLQFLVEALVLSVLGGIIGVVIGLLIGNFAENFDFTFSPNIGITIIAFLSSAIIGIIFGIFPAYRASKLNSIDALRS